MSLTSKITSFMPMLTSPQMSWVRVAMSDSFTAPDFSPAAWYRVLEAYYLSNGVYEQIMQEPDLEKGHALVQQAVRIHIDNGPFIGAACGNARIPVVINNNLHNVLEYGILGPWAISCPGNLNPEQWFFTA